jgi:hypothetical protein
MIQRTAEDLGAWLAARLTGDRGKTEWRTIIEGAWKNLLAEKLSTLIPEKEIEALLLAHLADETRLEAIVVSELRATLIPIVEFMRTDHQKVARWIPDDARARLLAFAAEKGTVDPAWIRSIFREKAIEALVSDTLYRALIDFSTIVPRMIQSLLPGGLAKLGGIGTRVVEEIEKRLEPEIRKFLDKGTRRALETASQFTIDHLDDKLSVEFRKNMLAFAIDQHASFHVHALTDARMKELETIARSIARHVAKSEETKSRTREAIEKIAKKHGEKPILEVLRELGAIEEPPFDQWADATFTIVSRAVRSPEIAGYMGRIALELLEELEK